MRDTRIPTMILFELNRQLVYSKLFLTPSNRKPMKSSPVIDLTKQLIKRSSVTPDDAGCQTLLGARLEAMGFTIKELQFGNVSNFWAIRGDTGPILAFAGHTDVVPPGPDREWRSPPFEPTVAGEYLYGRGAADMKGSLAAMTIACERFVAQHPNHTGRLAFLITSDEEGPAVDGTVRVMEYLQQQHETIRWCVVGEPTSTNDVADTIKNGRRGSLGGVLRIDGVQGHIAYPDKAVNPIHTSIPALNELTTTKWDEGNQYFPATSFQISNINAGTGATNVIPGQLEVIFNFRYSTETSDQLLIARVERILSKYPLTYTLEWSKNGQPFLTDSGELVQETLAAIKDETGRTAQLSTSGGTSDGRFIAPSGAQVIELGPCNESIHKVNECVKMEDLELLALIYENLMIRLLGPSQPAHP